jgi:hypothetical protein
MRIAAAGTSGVRLLQLLHEMPQVDQDLTIAAMSDDQLLAIVSAPDESGIDVRRLTDAQLEAIING